MNIRKLIIEDVRCFAGRQEFNIRPLTFLVGENSTGKSTALGCFQSLRTFLDPSKFNPQLDFNIEPYQMGAFSDIVRSSSPKNKNFILGFEFTKKTEEVRIQYLLKLEEKEKGSEPTIQEQRISSDSYKIALVQARQKTDRKNDWVRQRGLTSDVTNLGEKNGYKQFRVQLPVDNFSYNAFNLLNFLLVDFVGDKEKRSPQKVELHEILKKLLRVPDMEWLQELNFLSFAPIRSKPQRTYDPLKETSSPEGSDTPMVLMNMARADEKAWEYLKEQLINFGKSSGMFTDIHVRRLGRSIGDPFQIQIKVRGPRANMIDVGYGVNQLLPILVSILKAPESTTFLMQQPEVHLHPRGQAELSSLLAGLIKQKRHNFLIETHSDHMVDRARIEIMNKKIVPDDVSLIYLEPDKNSVKVHNIGFDGQGNLLGAPASYRQFFLRESDKLLGFG